MSRLPLAQQIAQLEETAPLNFDPEDAQITDTDGEGTVENLGARAHYITVGPSALRKLHDSVADPKYEGRRTTRQQVVEMDQDVEEDSSQSSLDGGLPSQSDPDGDGSDPGKVEKTSTVLPKKDPEADDLSSTLRQTRDEDRKKGKAVARQIAIWDSLLDARIRLQKSVSTANKLPSSSDISRFSTSPEARQSLDKMLEEAMFLSDEIFELQEGLLVSNEALQPPPRKRRRTEAIEPVSLDDYASQVREASQAASVLQHTIHPHLVQILTKWSSKIQAVAPSVLIPSNRGAFSNKSTHGLKSAVQLVDEALQGADYDKILTRTRLRRGIELRVGKESEMDQEENEDDIYDDTDFYQQLLRDVIDARGGGNGVGGTDDWMVMQKQRKAKRKVDSKASKGRKLRYEVHEKLQNFMVPVAVQGTWHEEQINELFASLLGKDFENVRGVYESDLYGTEKDAQAVLEVEWGEAVKGGFRVFG